MHGSSEEQCWDIGETSGKPDSRHSKSADAESVPEEISGANRESSRKRGLPLEEREPCLDGVNRLTVDDRNKGGHTDTQREEEGVKPQPERLVRLQKQRPLARGEWRKPVRKCGRIELRTN